MYYDHDEELIIDSFAGGGGASLGIERATGRSPDIAVNHDADAIAMHTLNHPKTLHIREDVWHTRMRKLVAGRPVGLLWASPDCKHFSVAAGKVPRSKEIRSLAWIICKWAHQVRPRVIFLENVREFETWGPLTKKGKPHKRFKGRDFKRFVGRLNDLGYDVEWTNLNAADYGTPTCRRRLFLVARNDDQPIVWPEETHGNAASRAIDPSLKPWRSAAECIDWSIPCPSIFGRRQELKDNTQRRIAMGIKRYVLEDPQPFIVPITHSGGPRIHSLSDPLRTITTAHRGEFALVAPIVTQLAHGGGGTWDVGRSKDMSKPLGTIHAGGENHALAAAFLAKHYGGVTGVRADVPLPTTTMRGTQTQIVAANMVHMNHSPGKNESSVLDPLRTATTNNHAYLVYSFMVKYFGTAIGSSIHEPIHTITTKDRMALVTVTIGGETYAIVDIGMRMLTPRELARAQGFPNNYHLLRGRTKSIARIGNSVCPPVAQALVAANFTPALVGV